MSPLLIVGIIIAILILWFLAVYNRLVVLRQRTDEAWSDIDVQLKRRHDLVPNLVETVKGYAKHEKELFEKVTEARAKAISAKSPHDQGVAENMLTDALKSVFAVAEAYPDLKASDNFKELQRELTDTEDKIEAARRFYNGNVRDLNTAILIFPNTIVAGMLNIKQRQFFEVDVREKEPITVDFSSKEKKEE